MCRFTRIALSVMFCIVYLKLCKFSWEFVNLFCIIIIMMMMMMMMMWQFIRHRNMSKSLQGCRIEYNWLLSLHVAGGRCQRQNIGEEDSVACKNCTRFEQAAERRHRVCCFKETGKLPYVMFEYLVNNSLQSDSFCCASRCPWKQLPDSFCRRHPS